MHSGTKPVFCHTRVWVPNLVVFVILGCVPGFQTCFGHTRVCTRGSNLFVLVIIMYAPRYHNRVCTRVPNLFVLVVLGYVPGYQTWLFGSYPGMYPGTKSVCLVIPGYVSGYQTCFFCHTRFLYKGTKPVCFDHTRVCTWVPREYTHY